ncbi:MAG: hypothetical protein ACREFZ_00930 [Acetobacteraceae bacterium]
MIPAAAFAALAVLAGAASLFARTALVRCGAYCVLLCAVSAVWLGALGHARPVALLPGIGRPNGTVVAFRVDEPRAIYVWLAIAGTAEPLALRLPWQERRAEALVAAERQAQAGHGTVRMRGRHGSGRGSSGHSHEKPMFYPTPPAPLPAKTER